MTLILHEMTLSEPTGRLALRWRAAGLAVLLVGAATVQLRAGANVEVGDAYVVESPDGRRWEVGNRAVSYLLALDASGALVVDGLSRPGSGNLIVPGRPDAAFAFEDQRVAVGDRAFRFVAAEAANIDGRAVLTLAFELRDRAITVGRHYAVAPGTPVLEMWTSVHGDENTTLRDLEGARLELTARDAWWFRGHDTGDDDGGPFARQAARIDDGQRVEFGSAILSSQEALPWFGLTAGDTARDPGPGLVGRLARSAGRRRGGHCGPTWLARHVGRRTTRSPGRVPTRIRRGHQHHGR